MEQSLRSKTPPSTSKISTCWLHTVQTVEDSIENKNVSNPTNPKTITHLPTVAKSKIASWKHLYGLSYLDFSSRPRSDADASSGDRTPRASGDKTQDIHGRTGRKIQRHLLHKFHQDHRTHRKTNAIHSFILQTTLVVIYHLRENDYSFDALQTYCLRINIKL